MVYTLGEAAKATGKSKPAIAKAIAQGRISATKDETGQWKIDPAELHRVYPPVVRQVGDSLPMVSSEKEEIARLKGTVEGLERLCRQIEDERDSLRHRLDREGEERRQVQAQLTALLTDQRPKPRRWMLPAVIGVAVLAVLLLLIAFGHPVRSALP
jgi:excisionase family DNA binding protein